MRARASPERCSHSSLVIAALKVKFFFARRHSLRKESAALSFYLGEMSAMIGTYFVQQEIQQTGAQKGSHSYKLLFHKVIHTSPGIKIPLFAWLLGINYRLYSVAIFQGISYTESHRFAPFKTGRYFYHFPII